MTMPLNPLLRELPTQLDTERLTLRCPCAGDGAALNAAIVDTLDDLRAFPASMPWAMTTPAEDDTEAYCRSMWASHLLRKELTMLLICKETQQVIGNASLHRLDWTVPKCEIGYWCRHAFQGRGYVSEAVRAMTAFAFDTLRMRRVDIFTDERNAASRRVCERTGYTLEGILRQDRIDPDGTLRNTCVYAQVR